MIFTRPIVVSEKQNYQIEGFGTEFAGFCKTESLVLLPKLGTIGQRCEVGKTCTRIAEKNIKAVLIDAVSFSFYNFHLFFTEY